MARSFLRWQGGNAAAVVKPKVPMYTIILAGFIHLLVLLAGVEAGQALLRVSPTLHLEQQPSNDAKLSHSIAAAHHGNPNHQSLRSAGAVKPNDQGAFAYMPAVQEGRSGAATDTLPSERAGQTHGVKLQRMRGGAALHSHAAVADVSGVWHPAESLTRDAQPAEGDWTGSWRLQPQYAVTTEFHKREHTKNTAIFFHMASDPSDASVIYVTDFKRHVVQRLHRRRGSLLVIAGRDGVAGHRDGLARDALFKNPHGLCVDPSGAVFVVDSGNAVIRRIDPDGYVTTAAGVPNWPGHEDGDGHHARFTQGIYDIVCLPDHSVLVGDPESVALRHMVCINCGPVGPGHHKKKWAMLHLLGLYTLAAIGAIASLAGVIGLIVRSGKLDDGHHERHLTHQEVLEQRRQQAARATMWRSISHVPTVDVASPSSGAGVVSGYATAGDILGGSELDGGASNVMAMDSTLHGGHARGGKSGYFAALTAHATSSAPVLVPSVCDKREPGSGSSVLVCSGVAVPLARSGSSITKGVIDAAIRRFTSTTSDSTARAWRGVSWLRRGSHRVTAVPLWSGASPPLESPRSLRTSPASALGSRKTSGGAGLGLAATLSNGSCKGSAGPIAAAARASSKQRPPTAPRSMPTAQQWHDSRRSGGEVQARSASRLSALAPPTRMPDRAVSPENLDILEQGNVENVRQQ